MPSMVTNGTYTNGSTHKNGLLNGHHHVSVDTSKLAIENAVRTILDNVGEDSARDGLLGTPDRVARMYDEILGGYSVDIDKLVNNAMFPVEYNEPVIVRDIEFFSMCEHHMLPFYGTAHVAYIPSGQVIGLSKIPRIVDMYARRLQIQERMTNEIAEQLDEILQPEGIAVVIEGSHMCSVMRGVKKEHARMITSAYMGRFKDDLEARKELLGHLQGPTTSLF